MKKLVLILSVAAIALGFSSLQAADVKFGFVNFKECVEKSKYGVQEKNAFEALRKQMTDTLEKTDKELEEMAKKLEDQDYMDGLSPSAEEELKMRFQGLSQEYARYQNQFYQMLNQANYKMIQSMHDRVASASEKIRERNHLGFVFNEDSTFAYASSYDMTNQVVDELNKQFDLESHSTSGKE